MATRFVATGYCFAGDDHLVGLVSLTCAWLVVRRETSTEASGADRPVYDDAYVGVRSVSGKRRYGLPAEISVAGLLFHLRGCRRGAAERTAGRETAAGNHRETGTRRTPSGARDGAAQ